MTHGRWIHVQESDEHFADDPCANRTETITVTSDVSLTQHVIPKGRFAAPPCLSRPHFVDGEGFLVQVPRNRLPRWQANGMPSFEVTNCQRMKFLDLGSPAVTAHRQRDQCADQASVDLLGAGGGRPARRVEQAWPFNPLLWRDGPETDRSGKISSACSSR